MIRPEQIGIFSFGYATLQSSWWLENVNRTNLMNRIYYFFDEGVSCRANRQQVVFLPGRFYLLPANLPLCFSLDPKRTVRQFYIDFYIQEVSFREKLFEADENDVMREFSVFLRAYLKKHEITGIVNGKEGGEVSEMIRLKTAEILMLFSEQESVFAEGDGALFGVVSYMQKHYGEPVSLETLCRISALSENQLIRNFQKRYQITPYQYLKQFRMNMAMARLSAGESVTSVAEEVGFSSVAAFSNAFKKFYGVAPSRTN